MIIAWQVTQGILIQPCEFAQWAFSTATFTAIFIALVMLYAMLDYARRRRLLFVPESKV